MSPEHEKQAASDDAVAVKFEDAAIELGRNTGISSKLRVAPHNLSRSNERLPRLGIGRASLSQLFIRDDLTK